MEGVQRLSKYSLYDIKMSTVAVRERGIHFTRVPFMLLLDALILIIFARSLSAVVPAVAAKEDTVLAHATREMEACLREAEAEGILACETVEWRDPQRMRTTLCSCSRGYCTGYTGYSGVSHLV